MPISSPSGSDLDKSSDIEKIASLHTKSSDNVSLGDIEKRQELRRKDSRSSNNQALPGLRLDDDDIEPDSDGDSTQEPEEQRGGLGRVVGRVLSRSTTKSSWNPGPPPDGGVKAWTAG